MKCLAKQTDRQTKQAERETDRQTERETGERSDSPMTQKGFLANLSRPLSPLYLQQQPAAQILTIYSTPNTTMVTTSCYTSTTSLQYPQLHQSNH